MADATAIYTVNLEGNVEQSAAQGAAALQSLSSQLTKVQSSAKVASTSVANTSASTVTNLKAVGGAAGEAGAKAGGMKVNMRALAGVLTDAGAEAGTIAAGVVRLAAMMQRLGHPILIGVALLASFALAAVSASVALVQFSLASSDAARAQLLFATAAVGSAVAGAQMVAWAGRLSERTGLAASKIRDMGLSFARAGLQGHNLGAIMEAASIATSAFGEGAGEKIASIAEEAVKLKQRFIGLSDIKLQGTGLKVADVAGALAKKLGVGVATAKAALLAGKVELSTAIDAMNAAVKEKFGAIAEKQSIGLGVQFSRLKENIATIFSGVDIDPFLRGLKDMLNVFSQETVAGQSLKAAMKGIATPLIEGLTLLMPLGKQVFYGMIIAALQLAIVMMKVRNAIRDGFATDQITVAKVVVYALVAGLAAIAAVVTMIVAVLAIFVAAGVAAFAIVGGLVYGVYAAITGIGGAIVDFWNSISLVEIGSNLISGLVNGIKAGAGFVLDAIKGIGAGIVSTLSQDLQIHSPSLVFRGLGMNTALGFAEGVDAGAGDVNARIAAMVDTPAASAPASGGKAKAGPGIMVHIDQILIDAGVKNARQIAGSIALELERALLSVGALPEPEPEGA